MGKIAVVGTDKTGKRVVLGLGRTSAEAVADARSRHGADLADFADPKEHGLGDDQVLEVEAGNIPWPVISAAEKAKIGAFTKEILGGIVDRGEWKTKVKHVDTGVQGEIRGRDRGGRWAVIWADGSGHAFTTGDVISKLKRP